MTTLQKRKREILTNSSGQYVSTEEGKVEAIIPDEEGRGGYLERLVNFITIQSPSKAKINSDIKFFISLT